MGDAAHHLVRFSDPEDLGGLKAGDGARESLDTEPQRPVVQTRSTKYSRISSAGPPS